VRFHCVRRLGVVKEISAMSTSEDGVLSMVSHELRTPLTAVLAYARLLGSGRLDSARMMNAIHTIQRNAEAMGRIIDDLLDVSGLIGGHVSIEPAPVDLVAVVEGALDDVRPAAEAGGLHLRLTRSAAPVAVAGDALRLQQVVANLLANAIKFTPPGGHVEVQLGSGASGVEIRVSDTGQGISAEFLPRIFDRFARAGDSITRRQGGLGLGLTLVRALVERHGGTVEAESRGPGHGATFTVRLPALARPETAMGPRSNGLAHGPSASVS
jgi:signal transduction histidine kinase